MQDKVQFLHRIFGSVVVMFYALILLHSERPKLYAILAFLSVIGLTISHRRDISK